MGDSCFHSIFLAKKSAIVIILGAHQLYLSNVLPALPLLIKGPQRFFEGRNLPLHLDENVAPIARRLTPHREVSQYLH